MKTSYAATLIAGLLLCCAAFAAPPSDAPAGTTGLCKDGTYYSGATKKGACKGHKGVKDWYADATGKPDAKADAKADAKPAAATATAPAGAALAAQAPAKPAAAPAAGASAKPAPASSAAAPGGGPGLVWVNDATKVYHCAGSRWYGKTKQGEYLSEADAKAKGNKADHGKACGK